QAIAEGVIRSAHDCAEGGLFVALAESCLKGNLGAGIDAPLDYFDESPSRIVVSTSQPDALAKLGVPMTRLGSVGGQRLIIPGVGDLSLDDMRSAYEGGLA